MGDADQRIDEAWDGPTPEYAVFAALGDSVTREDMVIYLTHTLSQTIDAAVGIGRTQVTEFPAGSAWDRDWAAISRAGMTEQEVSFLLSDVPDVVLRNAVNFALGLAVNQLIESYGPEFFTTASCLAAQVLARQGGDEGLGD